MQTKKKPNLRKTMKNLSGWLILPLALLVAGLLGVLALTACGLLPGAAVGSVNPQPTVMPPTLTPTLVPSPTMAWTPTPTHTAAPSPTAEAPVTPVSTEAPGTALPAAMAYQAQVGAPWYIPAFAHQGLGCRWVGLAGQVFDENGQGADGVLVVVSGAIEGKPAEWMGMTSLESLYGPGGYEVSLADYLPETAPVLSVQLFDLQGQALSEPFDFALPQSCERNLTLVNFQTAAK